MLKRKIKRAYLFLSKSYHKVKYGSCAVLLYHRVTDIDTDPQMLCVTPFNFDRQLKLLSEKYKVLTVDEFHLYLKNNKKFPRNSILITFDDGYADNYIEALPILEKYNLQALFYIATGTLNTANEFWWDAVERIVLLSESFPDREYMLLGNKKYLIQNLNDSLKLELYNSILANLRIMKSDARDKIIRELAIIFNSTKQRASHRALTFDELKKMNQSKSAVIGAHTNLHPSLASLSYDEQMEEINLSKRLLEKILESNIIHFSYPFGTAKDYNSNTLSIVNKLGFELAAANYPSLVDKHTHPFQFPRFLVRNWDIITFEYNLKVFFY